MPLPKEAASQHPEALKQCLALTTVVLLGVWGGRLCLTEACFFRFHSFSTKRKYRRRPKASATRLQLISQSNYLNYCFALAQKEEARFKSRQEISAQSPPLSTMHNNFDQALIVL